MLVVYTTYLQISGGSTVHLMWNIASNLPVLIRGVFLLDRAVMEAQCVCKHNTQYLTSALLKHCNTINFVVSQVTSLNLTTIYNIIQLQNFRIRTMVMRLSDLGK